MTRLSNQRRLELLGSASTAVALLMAGPAIAAPNGASASFDATDVSVVGNKTVLSDVANGADVSAVIAGTQGGVQTDATAGGNTTNTASGNDVLAGATGSAFLNQIDLSTISNPGGTDGAAAMGLSSNLSGAGITSTATSNDVTVELTNFSAGSATNDENTISATTTANDGATLLSGAPASDYSSPATGSASASNSTLGGTVSAAQASLVASTVQMSIDPANAATTAGNTIASVLDSTADNIVTASPSVSRNTISATLTGNASQSTIDVAGDDTPQFAGSAVVTNLQDSSGAGLSSATNTASSIGGDVYSSGIPVNTLTGGLAVEGNTISSSARNNLALGSTAGQTGNEIVLDDALSFAGNAVGQASMGLTQLGSDYATATVADLAVQNVQNASGDDSEERLTISAQTTGGEVYGRAEALDSGSVSVSGNQMTATAQSNTASSRIANGENAAGFAGTAALSNLQGNQDVTVTAVNLGGTIQASVETGLTAGSVASDGNTVSASAYGNQVSQNADLQATTLAMGSGEASLGAETGLSAAGAVIVGSSHTNSGTAVSANQSSSISVDWIAVDDSVMVDSSLSASGNTQAAVALGSSAANNIALDGTTVGTGAGVVNLQVADETSSVEANSTGSQVGSFAGDSITESEAVVAGNLQRSIAYGASSGNALGVTANTVTIGTSAPTDVATTATFEPLAPSTLVPQVQSAYGVLNRQAQAGDVSATAVTPTAFENRVEGNVTSGTLQTDGNSFVAAAYGTDTANTASIDANAIDTDGDGYASVATVTNAQTVTGADILARATGQDVVLTQVYGQATDTSISTSANTIQALGYGNRSTANSVSVDATNIDTSVDDVPLRGSASLNQTLSQAVVDASFAAQNLQTSSGSVTASLLTEGLDPTSAQVRTDIGTSVVNSSVVSDDNMSAAGATANRATTSVALDANQLATTAGVQNAQFTSSNLSALIGVAGTSGSPGDPGTPPTPVSASGGSASGTMSLSGDTLTVSGSAVTVTFSDYTLSSAEAAYLNGLANVSGATAGGSSVTFAVGSIDTSVFNNFVFNSGGDGSGSGDELFTVSGFTIPGTPPTPAVAASPNQGGVTVAIGDDVINTSVSVAGNSTAGSVMGNGATNSLTASATDVSGGSGGTSSEATALSATADLVLSNVQADSAATETSSVFGTFAIDATAGEVNGSSLTVSNNSQRSDAGSNLATSTIDVSATNLSAGSALGSSQQSSAAVSALSDLDVFAPGVSTQSSTQMNANTNTARAVVNEANNTVQVAASNVNPVSAPDLVANPAAGTLTGDHTLVSAQTAGGSASAVASSSIFNGDEADLATTGLSSGSIEIAGNSTTAQSVANLAANAMSLDGSANQGASAGIANQQSSSAVVNAIASSTARVTLAGDNLAIPQEATADDASIRIAGNATTAVARGNSASNVLNMDAGATYGTIATAATGTGFASDGTVSSFAATGAVLNQQANTGAVSAISNGATYQVALNATDASPLVTGSAMSVSGNAVNAEAYGNNATNRIAMTALNSGTPSAAIANYQQNSAAVTATVTSVSYGVAANAGTIGNSAFSTTGNQVAATAVGNNAVSVIAAGN